MDGERESTRLTDTGLVYYEWFFFKVYYEPIKRELKRVYINGCRYNERLNTETQGSKTPHIHWVALVNIQ